MIKKINNLDIFIAENRKILEELAKNFGLAPNAFYDKRKFQKIVDVRNLIMLFYSEKLKIRDGQIGKIFNRDRTTIINAVLNAHDNIFTNFNNSKLKYKIICEFYKYYIWKI